jgi:hypothetical protein
MKSSIDKQKSGLAGEFFVAAELLKRNYQVSVTFGNAKAIDLLVYNDKTDKTFTVQVKSLTYKNCFPIKFETIKNDCIYVFVFLNKPDESVQYFILTGATIRKDPNKYFGTSLSESSKLPAINYGPLRDYESKWDVFER